ncbi:MAG: hypothetical protein ACYTFK_11625 [Planctomycetota bacterium]
MDNKLNEKWFIVMLLVGLGSGLAIAYFGSTKIFKASLDGFELETFQENVNSVKQEAIDELKTEVVIQKEAISSLIEKANNTREDLLEVAEMVSPPYLTFLKEKIKIVKNDSGYTTYLMFKPSKNRPPLGPTGFSAKVEDASNAKIIDFDDVGSEHVRTLSKKISNDGKEALFTYDPGYFEYPRVRLKTSGACKVQISSSHIPEPFFVDIE